MAEESINSRINVFIDTIKFENVIGSYNLALRTCTLLKDLISDGTWSDKGEFKDRLKQISLKIIESFPKENCFANVFNKFFKMFQDEIKQITDLKSDTLEIIQEMTDDIETSRDNIAKHALEMIHPNEIIMTSGKSATVEIFLKAASKERDFHVIVAEAAPSLNGREMASSLASHGIPTTLISDEATFALMSRVSKVIIGAHTITANGGIKCLVGAFNIALAAQHYSVPFIVCAATFKLSEKHLSCFDKVTSNVFMSPYNMLPANDPAWKFNPTVLNPVFDFIPPQLISLIITNLGGSEPSQMYRLVNEIYNFDISPVDSNKK